MVRNGWLRTAALLLVAACLLAALEIPRKPPDFAISMNDGKQLLISQYKGKVVVLAFVLTTCPHCQRAVGFLTADQNEFGPRGLQVLACAVESHSDQAVPGFIRQFHPSFPVGFNLDQAKVLGYAQHPLTQIPHMPIMLFLDREGIIRAQYEGDSAFLNMETMGQNIHKEIEDLLNAPPPAAARKAATPKKRS